MTDRKLGNAFRNDRPASWPAWLPWAGWLDIEADSAAYFDCSARGQFQAWTVRWFSYGATFIVRPIP